MAEGNIKIIIHVYLKLKHKKERNQNFYYILYRLMWVQTAVYNFFRI